MGLIDQILNDPFYKAFADKVSDDKKEDLEKTVRELLQGAEQIHAMIIDASSSENKKEDLISSIEHNISPEGIGSWQEKN